MWGRAQTLNTSSVCDHMKKYLLMNKLSSDHHHHNRVKSSLERPCVCGSHNKLLGIVNIED